MTYNQIMEAAGKNGASFETKRLAEDLRKLEDKGILDRVLPFDQRSWKDIAPCSDTLNHEFKRAVNSTVDTMINQGHLTDIDRYSLVQNLSFTGTSNFENIPTTEIGTQMLEGLEKALGSGIVGLPFDLPSDDPSDTWEVVKEIIDYINPF